MGFQNLFEKTQKVNVLFEGEGVIPEVPEEEKELGMEELENLMTSGNSQGSDEFGPDPKELAMGIEVEHEHSDVPQIQRKIALDHLAEIPDYYTRLKEMEEEGKAALKAKGEKAPVDQTEKEPVEEASGPVKHMTCAVCDQPTKGRQWWNRDKGFGVCPKCIDRMKGRGTSDEEIENLYGKKGVHWGVEK